MLKSDTSPKLVYLVDETPFIEVIGRGTHKNIEALRLFLSLSTKRNLKGKFSIQMPNICRMRLGWYFLYRFQCYLRSRSTFFCSDEQLRKALHKRLIRTRYAKSIVRWFPRRGLKNYFFGRRLLMEIFLYANEAKSRELKVAGERLEPADVISMETCVIAIIANRKNLHLLSFNPDFKYFADFRDNPNYITFTHLDIFLTRDLPNYSK